MRGWRKILLSSGKPKKAGVVILISGKIDLKLKKNARDKGGHHIMIEGSIIDEDITIVNNYALNIITPPYTRQILTNIKRGTGSNTNIVADNKTPFR